MRKARVDGKRVQDEDPEAAGEQVCSSPDCRHAQYRQQTKEHRIVVAISQPSKQLVNFSEVFLEQDWFHLSVRKSKTEGDTNKSWYWVELKHRTHILCVHAVYTECLHASTRFRSHTKGLR